MKKLLSLFLAMLMVLSLTTVSFASETANGWSGSYSVEAYGGRNDAVKVNGTAVLDTKMTFKGVVMLTADVYADAGGSISLEDNSGNQAGVITLADGKINSTEIAYSVNEWNTLKIFAMTGIKKYQVYLGDTFICEADIENAVSPTKVSVSSSGDLYIDNLKLAEMEKSAKYADGDLTENYVGKNFASVDSGASLKGVEDWEISGSNSNNYKFYSYTAGEFSGERVAMLKTDYWPDLTTSCYLRLSHSLNTDKKNHIIEGKFYFPSECDSFDNTAALSLFVRDTNGTIFELIALNEGNIIYNSLGGVVQNNVFLEDDWFSLRIEILYETQSYDVYINDTKVNAYPIGFNNVTYGEMPAFSQLNYQLSYQTAKTTPTIVYAKDFKMSQFGEMRNVEVFSENFDSDTSKFTYTDGLTTEEMTGPVNLSLISNSTNAKGDSGKGRLYNNKNFKWNYKRVTEDCPLEGGFAEGDSIDNYAASNIDGDNYEPRLRVDSRYHSDRLDLSGAQAVTVKFKFYNAAMSRHKTSYYAIDGMYVSLNKEITGTDNAYNIAMPGLYFYRFADVYLNDRTSDRANAANKLTYQSNGTQGVRTWYDAELTITPGEANPYLLTVNGKQKSYAANGTLTADDVAKLKYLCFANEYYYGGCYYLDDVSVSKKVVASKDYIKSLYQDSYKCYSENTVRDAVAVISLDGGKIDTVRISNASEVSDSSQVFVAVYDGTSLSKVAVFEKKTDGIYEAAEKNLSVGENSVVRVFSFANGTLVPDGIFEAVYSE